MACAALRRATKAELTEKLRRGRPVAFTPEEAAYFVENLRQAMAVTLERPVADIRDDARVFDELGLDSIDVFDLLDQLAETFEVQVALEELPESLLRGEGEATFRTFAEGLLCYFAEPAAPPAGADDPVP